MLGRVDIDKPAGMSSHDVVHQVRRLLGVKRVGHSGTLDPMATGVLNLYVGRATKFIDLLKSEDKAYVAELRFGLRSDTLDIWGQVETCAGAAFDEADLRRVLGEMRGPSMQTPPMVSAIKKNGVPLYRYARAGVTVERKARPIEIKSISLLHFSYPDAKIAVRCSKGTYIRSLIESIGAALDHPALMSSLVRTENDYVRLENCVKIEMVPANLRNLASFQPWPCVELDEETLTRFRQGVPNASFRSPHTAARLLLHYKGDFVGTARGQNHVYFREKMV